MRQYTLVFMEQRLGAKALSPVQGGGATASFTAWDEENALSMVNQHFLERLKRCVRAEMSSLRMIDNPSGGAPRLIDDSHEYPHFQDCYVKFNASTRVAEIDFDSTRTALFTVNSYKSAKG